MIAHREAKLKAIAEAEYDLYRAGFCWITNNSGVHLQISAQGRVIADYWPTTKKLIFRKDVTPYIKDEGQTLFNAIFKNKS